jgi:GAF domain-containing protein
VPELSTERRWPRFVARVRDLGVGSILAFQLYVAQDGLGALNLYSRSPYAFDDDAERVGALFATHAAIALARAQQTEQLTHAVDVRDLIGQAKGILIERHRLTGDQAFRLLVRASQTTNTKLAEVARRLIETGELAGRGG